MCHESWFPIKHSVEVKFWKLHAYVLSFFHNAFCIIKNLLDRVSLLFNCINQEWMRFNFFRKKFNLSIFGFNHLLHITKRILQINKIFVGQMKHLISKSLIVNYLFLRDRLSRFHSKTCMQLHHMKQQKVSPKIQLLNRSLKWEFVPVKHI